MSYCVKIMLLLPALLWFTQLKRRKGEYLCQQWCLPSTMAASSGLSLPLTHHDARIFFIQQKLNINSRLDATIAKISQHWQCNLNFFAKTALITVK